MRAYAVLKHNYHTLEADEMYEISQHFLEDEYEIVTILDVQSENYYTIGKEMVKLITTESNPEYFL